jgi:RimJ/RimL family protein N-acetyltransferase
MPSHPDPDSLEREVWTMTRPDGGPDHHEATDDWRNGLPALHAGRVTLREVRVEDAPMLCAHLTTQEVTRFISPPPATVDGFERFIRWSHRERQVGRHVCFAVEPAGSTIPAGIVQVRIIDPARAIAEWGFALGTAHWGTGLFMAGARRVTEFAFREMGIQRLEARACVANGRGTAALRKLGAVREAVLHESFERDGQRLAQGLWSLKKAASHPSVSESQAVH